MLTDLLSAPLPRLAARRRLGDNVPAVILAAGIGSRLRPVTERLIKPMVPVLNVPLLYWTVAMLTSAGVTDLFANACHLADQLRAAARCLRDRDGVALGVVPEPRPSGPAGGLIACRDALPAADSYLVTSGDAWTGLDFADLVENHLSSGADLTIVAKEVSDPHRFGVLELRGQGVLGMREKPVDPPPDALVSCGIYVLSHRAMRMLVPPPVGPYDFKDVVPMLLASGRGVRAYRTDAHWTDVGDMGSYLGANLHAVAGGAWAGTVGDRPSWRVGLRTQGDPALASDVQIYGSSLVGDGARIETAAVLDHAVIGPGARVGARALVCQAVLLPGAVVRDGEVVTRRVVW